MRGWRPFLFLFMLISALLRAQEPELLKTRDIHQIMQQILEQHVNKKQLTRKILQTALLNYINQFDPALLYLLESEVDPFLHLTDEQLDQILEQYKDNHFEIFHQLNQTIKTAIARARQQRRKIEEENKSALFHFQLNKDVLEEKEAPFATTLDQLKERQLAALKLFIYSQKHRYGDALTAKQKEHILNRYETHLRLTEDPYLGQNEKGLPLSLAQQENVFAIHVLKALAKSLDAHTSFYQAQEAFDMRVRLQKEFRGIGLVLKETPEGAIVTHLLQGGPAAQSQLIQVGDLLLEVDGTSVKDLSFETIMEKLHGDKNTQVILTFLRKGKEGSPPHMYTVELKRELIILNNDRVDINWEPFANGIIGRLTLHSFYQGEGVSSEQDVRQAIQELERKGKLRGLILDLRENGGGFLSQAVKVASLFINNGIIVISKYSNGEERFYRDVDGKITYDGPLIILTSKATASAAEIVAESLQDYGVALIVGDEHTYGKGTIQTQTITDDHSPSYFKVTVGKYYTVSGHTPQKEGVKADLVVPSHWSHEEIGESYLNSIEGDTIPPAYEDPLSDVPKEIRPWYLKYYLPTLQKRTNVWRAMLPTLRKNSQYRIEHNKNYQFYLKGKVDEEDQEEEEGWDEREQENKKYGEDDLQLQEAVNILKDMIWLHHLEINQIKR